MTKPSCALQDLTLQHLLLREIMDECEHLALERECGRGDPRALATELAKLRIAFAAHNEHEEALLPSILRELDAFGEVRIDRMLSDHRAEHRALRSRLDGPTSELLATLYELRAHLATEERAFLTPRVLRDDLVDVENAG